MGVGLVILALYLSLGLLALFSLASLGLLEPRLLALLLVSYLLGYLSVGALMGAIGSAANDLREAQGLLTPVVLVTIVPMLLWLPISQDPDSSWAVALSFVPPVSSFVTMVRVASAAPPPWWQAALSLAASALGAVGSLWFAGRIFRIGLLMFGKPPDLATLVRWVRAA